MDSKIIKGTTPTIRYTFKVVDPSDISVAYLTIKVGNSAVIERDLTTATVEANALSWILTQVETLGIQGRKITTQINWRTTSGIRGASKETVIDVLPNSKAEVI